MFRLKYPKEHKRLVKFAKAHGIPTNTPGFPHMLCVLNVMRTKKPHNDVKDANGHTSIDLPFGNWLDKGSGGELRLVSTGEQPDLNRSMPLASGSIAPP